MAEHIENEPSVDRATILDLRVLCRSLTHGYPMDDATRAKVVKRLSDALDLALSPRELVRVCTALISVDRARLAAMTASKPDQAPTVVIQNNGTGGKDTLLEFIERMNPEEATDWLNRYGQRMIDFQEGKTAEAAKSGS